MGVWSHGCHTHCSKPASASEDALDRFRPCGGPRAQTLMEQEGSNGRPSRLEKRYRVSGHAMGRDSRVRTACILVGRGRTEELGRARETGCAA